jgi:hypothetical protein
MTHALRAFDYRFTTSGSEGDRLAALLDPLRDSTNGPHGSPVDGHVEAHVHGDVGVDRRGDRYAITVDGRVVGWNRDLDRAVASAIWHITQAGIHSRRHSVLLHAAAVVMDGTVVIISGRSGSGKSTLAAQIVDDGGLYLTDEAVEIDEEGHLTDWLARPIALDRSSPGRREDAGRHGAPSTGPIQRVPGVGSRLAPTEHPPSRTAIILLDQLGEEAGQVLPRRSDVVARLIGETFPPASSRQDALERVERLTRCARRVELRGGTPAERLKAVGVLLLSTDRG